MSTGVAECTALTYGPLKILKSFVLSSNYRLLQENEAKIIRGVDSFSLFFGGGEGRYTRKNYVSSLDECIGLHIAAL